MPFKSKAQARYMFAKHPKIAKEFAEHTEHMGKLPERASKYAIHMEEGRKRKKRG